MTSAIEKISGLEEVIQLNEIEIRELKKALAGTLDYHSHNDEEWKIRHFYSQKKGDYAKPSRCLNCMCEKFIETEEGWRCKDCLALIWGSDYYQGRNSGKQDTLSEVEKEFESIKEECEGSSEKKGCDLTKNRILQKLKKETAK